jgi:hypothetical protein
MADFLRTTGITNGIENIIVNAKESLILVSPYVQLADIVLERLLEKSDDSINIIFIYGKQRELNRAERTKLEKIKNIEVYFSKNLHGKLYANEDNGIIASMNLYEFSERNNREFGISFNKKNDVIIYEEAMSEVKSILKISELVFKNEPIKKTIKEAIITINNETVNTSTLSGLEFFYQRISQSIPSLNFKLVREIIYCDNFFTEDFNLEITITPFRVRVDFKLKHEPYSLRNNIYGFLQLNSNVLEQKFPKDSLNWGNQMKRIKIDLTQNNHLPFFETEETLLKATLEVIQIGISEIVERSKLYK